MTDTNKTRQIYDVDKFSFTVPSFIKPVTTQKEFIQSMEPFLLLSVINMTFCTFKVKTYLLAETVVTKDFAIKQTHQKII